MILGMNPDQLAQYIVTGILVCYTLIKGRREWRARRRGLAPNPTRCQEHADAINDINFKIDHEVCKDLKRIKDHLGIV